MKPVDDFRLVKKDKSGCWLWQGNKTWSGYGLLRRDDKVQSTHRYFWKKFNGVIPAGKCVLHRCDVPSCVNPKHLFLGTQADNIRDMFRKGRANPRGRNKFGGGM